MALAGTAAGCGPAPRPEQLTVEMTGAAFTWQCRYPGPDGKLGTADDVLGGRDLHVPAGTQIEVQLRSKDYIYVLNLPHWGLKEVAIPDLDFSLSFPSGVPGSFQLKGDQMCGYAHPLLLGTLTVEPWPQFDEFIGSLHTEHTDH